MAQEDDPLLFGMVNFQGLCEILRIFLTNIRYSGDLTKFNQYLGLGNFHVISVGKNLFPQLTGGHASVVRSVAPSAAQFLRKRALDGM